MIFLGLPLNEISAEEVAETVANFSIRHKQDYLGKLLLTWEYFSPENTSQLYSFNPPLC